MTGCRGIWPERFRLLVAVALMSVWGLGSSSTAGASLVAYWDFNDQDLIVDLGSGSLALGTPFLGLTQVFASGTTVNAVGAAPAGSAFARQRAGTSGSEFNVDFTIDMTGLGGLQVSYAQRADTTWQPIQITRMYSLDGINFVSIGQAQLPATFLTTTFSVSSAINNNPNVVIRFFQRPNSVVDGQQWLIDNVQFNAFLDRRINGALASRTLRGGERCDDL